MKHGVMRKIQYSNTSRRLPEMRKKWNVTAQLNADALHTKTIIVVSNMKKKAEALAKEQLKKNTGCKIVEILDCVPVEPTKSTKGA